MIPQEKVISVYKNYFCDILVNLLALFLIAEIGLLESKIFIIATVTPHFFTHCML